ncbi:sensor histidine kinase KdpD [Motilibacter sp. K478]|nr:sensor histidine kinase KdpD [Motilibacter aurantiacus]
MTRGRLRIYLGAAPGVGKTYAMLGEARRRAERGTSVVVGFVEDHGRPQTAAMVDGLDVVPRRRVPYRGGEFEEMDVDAVLARRPQVAVVDELAHTNIPGSRNDKRWQDVELLLDAGIDVLSTLNVQHLESLNDVVEKITGVAQRETVPDEVARRAEQVQLVDSTPEALRRRMAHGNIYPAERVDAALSNYFRPSNLTALRELALLWLAEKVDEGLQKLRADLGVSETWETRERVVVALSGGPEGETLLRRAARIADRSSGADLRAVYVARSDGLTGASPAALAKQRRLVEDLGGTYSVVVGDDVPRALLQFARGENATQLVLGVSRHSRLAHLLRGPGTTAAVTRMSGDIDVHIVTHEHAAGSWRLPMPTTGVDVRRRWWGLLLSVLLPGLLTPALLVTDDALNLTSDVLLYLLAVVTVALVGGAIPAAVAAVLSTVLLNWFFTPPVRTFTIAERNNLLALVVFLAVGAMVSTIVDLAARRRSQAARATAEATTLSAVAGSVLRGETALAALLDRLRETFGMTSVSLLERRDDTGRWAVAGSSGPLACRAPGEADVEVPVGERLTLALRGRPLPSEDRRVLGAFAAQAAAALEHQRLAQAAAAGEGMARADRVRSALLRAVSHDLRTPLASAKAAVASLRSHEVEWSPEDEAELLETADESLDRLTRLVENLLDLSRLEAGALSVFLRDVPLDEVIPLALDTLGPAGLDVTSDVPETLPAVRADPALLERVVANLVSNALRYSPPGKPPHLAASTLGDSVELRVVDRGPGIPEQDRERAFVPFQRLGDTDNATGVGLGLALSRGLAEAMGGTLVPDDTPGGGLTMTLTLPAASPSGRREGTRE